MEGHALGVIYLLTNPAWPGFVSVGKSIQKDLKRGRLSTYQAGDPFRAYRFDYLIKVENVHEAERIAHKTLRGFRVGNSEWFRCAAYDAFRLLAGELERRGLMGGEVAEEVRHRKPNGAR